MSPFVWVNEDAYISFCIADNLAAGHGNVFNIGGERIELVSSVLWQLLLVPFSFLPLRW